MILTLTVPCLPSFLTTVKCSDDTPLAGSVNVFVAVFSKRNTPLGKPCFSMIMVMLARRMVMLAWRPAIEPLPETRYIVRRNRSSGSS